MIKELVTIVNNAHAYSKVIEELVTIVNNTHAYSKIVNQHIQVIEELVTIVDNTHAYSKIVNQHIQSLEKYVSAVAFEKRNWQIKKSYRDIPTSALQTVRTLILIETTHNMWLRQLVRYNRQRVALELGYLTEDIFDY